MPVLTKVASPPIYPYGKRPAYLHGKVFLNWLQNDISYQNVLIRDMKVYVVLKQRIHTHPANWIFKRFRIETFRKF